MLTCPMLASENDPGDDIDCMLRTVICPACQIRTQSLLICFWGDKIWMLAITVLRCVDKVFKQLVGNQVTTGFDGRMCEKSAQYT